MFWYIDYLSSYISYSRHMTYIEYRVFFFVFSLPHPSLFLSLFTAFWNVFNFTFSQQSPKQLQVWQIDSRTSHRIRLQPPAVLWFLSPLPKCVEYLLARFTLEPREQIGDLQRPQQKDQLIKIAFCQPGRNHRACGPLPEVSRLSWQSEIHTFVVGG